MFNWFAEQVAKRVKDKLDRDAQEKKNMEAFEFGEKVAESMIADLERFATHRFSQIEDNVLQILATAMQEAIEQNKVPHIILAREELAQFVGSQKDNRQKLVNEIVEGVSDWRDAFRKIDSDATDQNIGNGNHDSEGIITKLANARVDQFQLDLNLKALKVLVDNADALKLRDDQWRIDHPDESVNYPKPA